MKKTKGYKVSNKPVAENMMELMEPNKSNTSNFNATTYTNSGNCICCNSGKCIHYPDP